MTKNKNNIENILEEYDKWDLIIEQDVIRAFEGKPPFREWLKQKLQQVSDRKVEDIGNRVECASFSEEPDFECGRVLPISEMMSTVKNPDTFYCKECYQRGVDMENEAMGL